MKTVSARLDIAVYVDCPHCEHLINLLDTDDTSGRDLNEEGYILTQACPDGHWSLEHPHFTVEDVKCGSCGGVFDVKELEW